MTEFTSCEGCKNNHDASICIHCENNQQVTNLFEPIVKKSIDLSMMVESNIDMEFSNCLEDWFVDQLVSINNKRTHPYATTKCDSYMYCRIRQDHWHSWQGGDCPLPKGLIVEVILRNSEITTMQTHEYMEYNRWIHRSDTDIIAFNVYGPADRWKYEWEK